MQTKASFKSTLSKPCKRLLQLIKLPFRRHFSINPLRFRNLSRCIAPDTKSRKKKIIRSFLALFRSSRRRRRLEEMDGIRELKSMPDTVRGSNMLFPSPVTPAYVKRGGFKQEEAVMGEDVEEACRSFEKYLVEMIVKEGKVRDLMDVEELLYCWNKLKSPVFIEMVCRFYGELCRDLFSE